MHIHVAEQLVVEACKLKHEVSGCGECKDIL